MKFNHYIFGIVLVAGSLAACDNQDIEFDDYKFQAVYFGSHNLEFVLIIERKIHELIIP